LCRAETTRIITAVPMFVDGDGAILSEASGPANSNIGGGGGVSPLG
jgi:hypothetical protein